MAAAGDTLADAGKHTGCDAALNQGRSFQVMQHIVEVLQTVLPVMIMIAIGMICRRTG